MIKPLPVFVLDHGRHANLVLPAQASGMMRYAYGDWKHSAEAEPGFAEASATALILAPVGAGGPCHHERHRGQAEQVEGSETWNTRRVTAAETEKIRPIDQFDQ